MRYQVVAWEPPDVIETDDLDAAINEFAMRALLIVLHQKGMVALYVDGVQQVSYAPGKLSLTGRAVA